jgi:hypothetical protein
MTTSERSTLIRRNRPRGIYTPIEEVSAHLANGWRLMDDCPAMTRCCWRLRIARKGKVA